MDIIEIDNDPHSGITVENLCEDRERNAHTGTFIADDRVIMLHSTGTQLTFVRCVEKGEVNGRTVPLTRYVVSIMPEPGYPSENAYSVWKKDLTLPDMRQWNYWPCGQTKQVAFGLSKAFRLAEAI